jgi:hypothetical protein
MLSATDSGSQFATTRPAMLQNIPDLMVSMVQLDDDSVQQVRKTAESPPRVSVIDVIRLITESSSSESSHTFKRLEDAFPEVGHFVSNFKFPGRGQRDTPVTDAEGITQIIMLLPGRAAAIARQSAANVVVRYLGGDVSLVREIMANRNMQAQLEPDHPASIFGQSVRQGPTPYEIEMARNARMQALSAAYNLAQAIDSTSQARLRVEAQRAIDDVLLPQGETMDQYVDAATILRERAYTEDQIARMAGELGKDLKMIADSEGRVAQSNEQNFCLDRHQVGLYHRVRDASLVEDVLTSFKDRPLYARVMAGEPDPIAARRANLLNARGRGRSRSQRRFA